MPGRSDVREESLVRPVVSRRTPRLGPFAVIAGVLPDHDAIRAQLNGSAPPDRPLYLGRLRADIGPSGSSLAGPVLGAPQAVMTLETLLAWGARSVLFFGWCGGLGESVEIGDVIFADGAFCDEGTSPRYGASPAAAVPVPAPAAQAAGLRPALAASGAPVHTGKVWTTDAIFRETPSRVAAFCSLGAVAVDMETSALMSAAAYRGAALTCVLVVSDVLGAEGWERGFRHPAFLERRKALCRLIAGLLQIGWEKS